MKKTAAILILALVLSLCGSGWSGTAAAAPGQETANPAETVAIPVFGRYILYSIEYEGEQITPASMNISSSITLLEDGSGTMTMYGQEAAFPKWEEADGVLTLYNDKGDPLECSLQNGIVRLEMDKNNIWFYAHEGTGIAADQGRQFDSKLHAFWKAIDSKSGAHLNYEFHSAYLDSTSVFDVHARDGVLFSDRVISVDGSQGHSATFFRDGTAYVLYPDEHRGNIATTTGSSLITGDVLLLDSLYQTVYTMAQRGDYTEETRELEGVQYAVEVFPATAYKPETVFYYDKDGALRHILEGAPVLAPELGETFYTIHAVDTDVNEALFSISDYSIQEKP